MTYKTMRQICYGFYWSIKKWQKSGQTADFLAHFNSFLLLPTCNLWVMPQDFAKWKTFLRYISAVSFIRIAFVVLKLKIFLSFLYWFSVHEMAPFLKCGWARALAPQTFFDLAEILNRDSLPTRQTQCLKNPSKFWILAQIEHTQSLQHWSILGSNLPLENQKNCLKPKFLQKLNP